MAGEPEGGCRVQRPKNRRQRTRGWWLLFFSCFLCSASGDSVVGQGEHRQAQPKAHNGPSAQEIKKMVKQGKAKRKQQKKPWYSCFLRKSTAVSPADNHAKETRNAEECFRLAGACMDAVLDKLERDRKRAMRQYDIQRIRKTLEANRVWSCLPERPENIIRVVTFQEPVQRHKVLVTDKAKKANKRDLEWCPVLDDVRKEHVEKAAENNMQQEIQTKEPRWLTFLKGRSFDFKKDLTTLFLACTVFIFAWFCATTLSSVGEMYHTLESSQHTSLNKYFFR